MTRQRYHLGIMVAFVAALLVLGGCGHRAIDPAATNSQPVNGAGTLYRFCDEQAGVLIYWTQIPNSTEDEYEFAIPFSCGPYTETAPATPPAQNAPGVPQGLRHPQFTVPDNVDTDGGEN